MKEKLYTIPVNDGFDVPCECPICAIKTKLEIDAVNYTMGPSYMESDIREKTDEMGFCYKHIKAVYEKGNRLGMAWVLKTHFDKTINAVKNMQNQPVKSKGLFKKASSDDSPIVNYTKKLSCSCFVCDRVNSSFDRYLDTAVILWKDDTSFREKFANCKGFCTEHYGMLYERAMATLSGDTAQEFIQALNKLYIENMERVRDDLAWFINKFDYKYANEDWKNSKDALPRGITKTNSIIPEDDKENQ